MMIEPPHHMYRPLLWISHTNSNKTPKLKPHHVLFLPFSSLHSQTPLIDSQTHHHTMSVQARRLAVFCAHLNPTRLPLDPPAPFLSPSLCAPHSDTQNDCVFCNIIRGQSPALKVRTVFIFENSGQRPNPRSKIFRICTVNGIIFVPNDNVTD